MKERLLLFLAHLGLSQKKFEQAVGLSNGFVDKVGNGIRSTSIDKIVSVYPQLNVSWLLTGEGEMLRDRDGLAARYEALPVNTHNILSVPMISQYAYAGYLCGYGDKEYIETLPTIPFVVDTENPRGSYLAFEVRGDSMNDGTEDSLLEGDRLLCREIGRHLWHDSRLHIRRWDFVIVHRTEGVLVKRIVNHDIERGTITIHSLNPTYDDKVLQLADVAQLFNVVEVLRSRKR